MPTLRRGRKAAAPKTTRLAENGCGSQTWKTNRKREEWVTSASGGHQSDQGEEDMV